MLLAFLVLEQQVATASDRWKRSVYLELPVVAEQVGMLLGAGYSLTAALDRVARRAQGAAAQDLRRVLRRIRQGVPEESPCASGPTSPTSTRRRPVRAVLALNREATDLGRLIAEEARNDPTDVQRELVETMERRGQQVWIPVTVATLLPGVIFIADPVHRRRRPVARQPAGRVRSRRGDRHARPHRPRAARGVRGGRGAVIGFGSRLRGRLGRLRREEDGLSGGAEALVFGTLVFVVGTLIAVNAWAVVDAKLAVNAAAREAGRALAETTAPTWGLAFAAAEDAARATVAGHGKDAGALVLEVVAGYDPLVEDGSAPTRCRRVTVAAHLPVTTAAMPLVGAWTVVDTVTGRHSEVVDPLRSGLAGEAFCVG
jgi:hypothetical protein